MRFHLHNIIFYIGGFMTFEEFSTTKEFQNLHPVKQQILQEFTKSHTTLSMEALLPKLMHINKELSKRNLSFTKEETVLLINIMKENMTPQESQKVDMITNMFFRT